MLFNTPYYNSYLPVYKYLVRGSFKSSQIVNQLYIYAHCLFFVLLFRVFLFFLPSFLFFSVSFFTHASNLVSSSVLAIFNIFFVFLFQPFHISLLFSSYSSLPVLLLLQSSQQFPILVLFFPCFPIFSASFFTFASNLVSCSLPIILNLFFVFLFQPFHILLLLSTCSSSFPIYIYIYIYILSCIRLSILPEILSLLLHTLFQPCFE